MVSNIIILIFIMGFATGAAIMGVWSFNQCIKAYDNGYIDCKRTEKIESLISRKGE